MKTSNKLLIAAILIIIVSMVTYDFALRAEYLKGDYKSRFYGFEKTTSFNGFTRIDNRAANLISIDVEHGTESGIWVKSNWKNRFKIFRKGNTLIIEVLEQEFKHVNADDQSITIICPTLDEVTTTPYAMKPNEESSYATGTTTLTGFVQQDLALKINEASTLVLAKSKIQNLKALVGDKTSRTARLMIKPDNKITNATIEVLGRNTLDIVDAIIAKKNFTIADSATVVMSGNFLNQPKIK